jgi:hypothetical protein
VARVKRATKVTMMRLPTVFLVGIVLLFLLGLWRADAAFPVPPNVLTVGQSSTFNVSQYGPKSFNAIAGNITALVLTGIAQTKAWQGFYGNITGSITLDDAQNYTFYNWTNAKPRGQVYATLNSSINWGSVGCFNFSDATTGFANQTVIENYYSITFNDVDGVNETFNDTNHPTFQVGSRNMTNCPTTYIFQNDSPQRANFVNILLYDNITNQTGWIYTTLIENRTAGATNHEICYDGRLCDFQILVNENGHGTDIATTTYYFWVELI